MMARYYNGPAYASHHYHERLETWFKEFRRLL
ncbi:MAG: N-acetylmuramidase domain-containing protein [Thermodesulfobacteriota bacterium]